MNTPAAPAYSRPARKPRQPADALRRRKLAATVITVSVIIHLMAGLGAGLFIVAKYFLQPPAKFEVKKDIRLPAKEREHRMNMAEFDAMAPKPVFSEKLASLRPTNFALPDLPKVPLDQMIPLDPASVVADQVSSLIGAAGTGSGGLGGGGLGGLGSGMSFFGIKDTGRSVVIMIDVSDSMFGRTGDYDYTTRKKLREGKDQSFQAVRDEAIKLIDGLGINTRFAIVRWSGGAYAWPGELVPATDQNKAAARRHIQEEVDVRTAPPREGRPGGTRHDYALEEAFRLKPEVIFMLTDGNATEAAGGRGGGVTPIPAQRIYDTADQGQRGLERPARLHVIYYLTGEAKDDEERMLRGLASRNGGKFNKITAPRAASAPDRDRDKPRSGRR